jgi:glycosyltransferase involved in cell wall biosynthesis
MPPTRLLRVHVLIDLEWRPESGGQVTCWENLAHAARHAEGLHLTLHAQGKDEEAHDMHPRARLLLHKAVFSTKRIPFLQAPAHTDLAPFHPGLAASLTSADVIHTTDGFFAYAKTAEKVAGKRKIPLTHSVHTDTASYARIFTHAFLQKILGPAGELLDDVFGFSRSAARSMQARLAQHQSQCRLVLTARENDQRFAERVAGVGRVWPYRLGIDGRLFNPGKRGRQAFRLLHQIPSDAVIVLFAGRLDEGKNIMRLIEGMESAIKHGAPLFLVAAGIGPARPLIHKRLGTRVCLLGFLTPEELAIAYASADWLALPSTVETWGLVVAEALASGLPVIASCASGVGRFLEEEGAGFLVKEDTSAAWEAALMGACAFRDVLRLRELARAASSHFVSWEEALIEDFMPAWTKAAEERN